MSVIDDIKERLDIVEIIGQQVQLRKTGRSYLGFCPFHHNTRTPAFNVYPDTQTFYCFGCQASGSVFDFVMRQQGLDFREALEQLAQRAGVPLKERTDEEKQLDQKRTRLLDITSLAARYFSFILQQHSRGQPARDYLEERGITASTIESFQLGYSFREWAHLLGYLTEQKGYTPEEVEQAGLAIRRDEGGWYDRFRGRLIFPIRNAKGDVVGFGGRIITTETTGQSRPTPPDAPPRHPPPKYINTPQTLLFDKSHVLYGLDLARDDIRRQDSCVVVEGYVDVLTAHQHGFRNVVAPLGTSLTAGHITMLKKLTRSIYMALDADAAGQKATLRGISALQHAAEQDEDGEVQPVITADGLVRWESDITLHIIKMPPGQDPDEVIKTDPQLWQDLIAQAVPVVDFYIQAYTADLDLTDPQHQRTALDRLLPILAELEGTVQRVYIAQLERLVGIRAELILDMVRSSKPRPTQQHPQHLPQQQSSPHSEEPQERNKQRKAIALDPHLIARDYRIEPLPLHEDYLLALIFRYPATRSTVDQIIQQDLEIAPQVQELLGKDITQLLQREENRAIWQTWLAANAPQLAAPKLGEQPKHDTMITWAQELGDTLRSHVEYLASLKLPRTTEYTYMRDAESCVRHLRIKQVRHWQLRLSKQTRDVEDAEDIARAERMLVDLSRYLARITAPPQSKGFLDMRHTVERESH
jgi:DNA primase